jgi:hypothetical protein
MIQCKPLVSMSIQEICKELEVDVQSVPYQRDGSYDTSALLVAVVRRQKEEIDTLRKALQKVTWEVDDLKRDLAELKDR